MRAHVITLTSDLNTCVLGVGWGVLTGLLVPVAFRNKCERVTGPTPEPFQSIFTGVNATRTSGTGLERDRNANRNRCEQLERLMPPSPKSQVMFAPAFS